MQKSYVKTFWEGNPSNNRVWLPWSWAETVKQQKKNNSIVLFSPSDESLHGVKADYDHLATQRTQLYGNLWYQGDSTVGALPWESLNLDLKSKVDETLKQKAIKLIPPSAKVIIKKLLRRDEIGKRKSE